MAKKNNANAKNNSGAANVNTSAKEVQDSKQEAKVEASDTAVENNNTNENKKAEESVNAADKTAAEKKAKTEDKKKTAESVKKEEQPKKKKFRRRRREKQLNRSMAGNTLLFSLMIFCGVFMVLPLVMIINNCLKPLDELFQYPPKLFVRNPTLENFTDLFVLMNDTWVPFSRYILNTFIITVGGMVGHVICASLAAYPLAKHKFPGKDLLFSMVVLSMMFSWTVTQIPQYMIISWLGINNTYLALILPAWSFGMGLYLMKQFMEQLPDSLMESARLDGANELTIFWKIVMPNVKPAWLTLAIFQFQQMWANTGALFLRDEQLKPLQFSLQQITAGGTARAGAAAAVTFLIAAVPIIFFLICQRNVLETMTTSGMKD